MQCTLSITSHCSGVILCSTPSQVKPALLTLQQQERGKIVSSLCRDCHCIAPTMCHAAVTHCSPGLDQRHSSTGKESYIMVMAPKALTAASTMRAGASWAVTSAATDTARPPACCTQQSGPASMRQHTTLDQALNCHYPCLCLTLCPYLTLMASATASAAFWSRSHTTTAAPCAASSLEAASPIPLPPPVHQNTPV